MYKGKPTCRKVGSLIFFCRLAGPRCEAALAPNPKPCLSGGDLISRSLGQSPLVPFDPQGLLLGGERQKWAGDALIFLHDSCDGFLDGALVDEARIAAGDRAAIEAAARAVL